MSSEPRTTPPTEPAPPPTEPPAQGDSTMHAYNMVTDTVMGVNFRVRDNLIQAGVILVITLIAAGVGFAMWGAGGAAGGALGGLVLGVLISGAILGVYRMVRHAQGKHD